MLIRKKTVVGTSHKKSRRITRLTKSLSVERIGGHREYVVAAFDPWSTLWDVPTNVRIFGKLSDAFRYYESI